MRGEMNWRKEAELALRDVRFAVDHCWVSEKLPSTRDCAFFNLTTVEGQEFCVRLSWRGFEVNVYPVLLVRTVITVSDCRAGGWSLP